MSQNDQREPPPSSPTGRHRALRDSEPDWQTHIRGVDQKVERSRREDAKHRGQLYERVTQCENAVRDVGRQVDANITHVALLDHRADEVEADVSAMRQEIVAIARFTNALEGALATARWAIPVIIAMTSAVASGITYLLVHH